MSDFTMRDIYFTVKDIKKKLKEFPEATDIIFTHPKEMNVSCYEDQGRIIVKIYEDPQPELEDDTDDED